MYNKILREISLEYERRRDRKNRELNIRKQEVYRSLPIVEKIDEEIFETGLNMAKSVLANPEKHGEIARKAREKMEKLRMEKAVILTEANIPANYMEMDYECEDCQDKGYLENGQQCHCLRQKLVSRAYEMSNIEEVLKRENFNNFNINIFSDEKYREEKYSPRENMDSIAGVAQKFIETFDEKNGVNLLFYGTTGLGKTFLSNCIAKELIDKNKIVIYQTAFTILEIIERHRFGRGDKKYNEYQYNLLFEADLLIIDDLGTEVGNTFTNAEIFNIVNTRIIGNKKTIISTNLTPKEISNIYTDRVFSRISDKFLPLKFYGDDLRWK